MTEAAAPPPALSAGSALYMDFDGTLTQLAARPDAVEIPAGLTALLDALRLRLEGAIAILSGRRLADLDTLLAPLRLAGAGVHGAEIRAEPDGTAHFEPVPGIESLSSELRARFASDPRLLIEDKLAAVALHFRQAPERAAECVAAMKEFAPGLGLRVIRGHEVVEAWPSAVNKGAALRRLSAHAPFAGRVPVFVGDDTTDEHAFEAAATLGGHGVKVGPGASCARYRCRTVEDVHAWLRNSLQHEHA